MPVGAAAVAQLAQLRRNDERFLHAQDEDDQRRDRCGTEHRTHVPTMDWNNDRSPSRRHLCIRNGAVMLPGVQGEYKPLFQMTVLAMYFISKSTPHSCTALLDMNGCCISSIRARYRYLCFQSAFLFELCFWLGRSAPPLYKSTAPVILTAFSPLVLNLPTVHSLQEWKRRRNLYRNPRQPPGSSAAQQAASPPAPVNDDEDDVAPPGEACVVCLTRTRRAVFLNCGHRAACFPCAQRVADGRGICPLCRQAIVGVVRVYDP